MIGQAQQFDGAGDHIAMDTISGLDIQTSAITIEAWVELDTVPPDWAVIAGEEGYPAGYRIMVGPAARFSDRVRFVFHLSSFGIFCQA